MPTIKITPANSSITIGQTQSFTAEISDPVPGSATTYKWFVDGELDDTSAIETFSLTPSTAGAKTIKVESTSTDSEAEPVVLTDECTITVDAENYLTFTTKSSHSVTVEKASPEYEEGCTKYIHSLDHRESAYLWQGWWVMKEIEAAVEKGIDWKNPDETELNYKCDLKTIAYMLDKFPNIEIQESKNGYILNKATIESGYIY